MRMVRLLAAGAAMTIASGAAAQAGWSVNAPDHGPYSGRLVGPGIIDSSQGTRGVVSQPLGLGEVLLEVNAVGTAPTRAVRAQLTISIMTTGSDAAAARAAHDTAFARVQEVLRGAGVAPDGISRRHFDVTGEPSRTVPAPAGAEAAAQSRSAAMGYYEVEVADAARVQGMVEAIDAIEGASAQPQYRRSDDPAAQRTARQAALANARAEAEAYAADLGMRVVRIVRVTERTGVNLSDFPNLESLGPAMFGPARGDQAEVTVFAVVGLDVVLAPR